MVNKKRSYGLDNPLQEVFPSPIIGNRAPTTNDKGYQIGQKWIYPTTNAEYTLTSVSAGSANWELSTSSGGAAPLTKFVVDPDGTADYATVQAAVTAASALGGALIAVRPGTYTENLTLYDGIVIQGAGIETTITGAHTPPASGAVIFMDAYLTSATDIVTSAAAGSTRLRFVHCTFNCTNGYVVDCANWTGAVDIMGCNTVSTADGVVNVATSTVAIENSFVGAGANALGIAGGTLAIRGSRVACPISPTGASAVSIAEGCYIGGTITVAGTSALAVYDSTLSTGAAAAVTQSSAGAVTLSNVNISSSANPCVTGAGAGAVKLSNVNFLSNALLAGTLTRSYVAETKNSHMSCGDATYRVNTFTGTDGVVAVFADDATASGASELAAVRGDLTASAGDGNNTPEAVRGNMSPVSGANVLQATGVLGYNEQADGSVIASTASGTEGWLNILETDAADLPQVYAFGVKGYLDSVDTAAAPLAGIFAGVGSVVEYNTPFDDVVYGMAVTRLDAGGGAGTAGLAAYGVVQGTVAAADWLYGLDLYNGGSGVAYTNADVRFQNQSTCAPGTEGVLFSGNVFARALDATNTRVAAFNVNPIGQLAGGAGALCTGATGTINNIHMQDGIIMQSFMIGAGQTKIIPVLEADGLEIALDLTATEGVEYNFGYLSSSKHVYTIGTDLRFFVEATFKVADVSGCEPLLIGFRKIEANNGTYTAYTDYASIGIVTSQNADLISLATELNSGGTTYTNTTDAFTDGQTHTLRVNVDADGNVTYLIDGVAPTATAAFQFDATDQVMPFIHLVHAAVAPGKVHLVDFDCGFQAWT